MDAERRLKRLYRRHGLPPDDASELLPLMERAMLARPEIRRCLEAVVEATLAARAARRADEARLAEQVDRQVLLALAGLLHGWKPG